LDIFSILALIGGVALFLFGMNIMSSGLERASGSKLERGLKKLTSNKAKSLAVGAGITVAMQSSSALTVMLVGLVNSGVMALDQTIGVIMGSNIGTTLTGWLLSLTGLESSNVALQMCKPENFSPILALLGVVLIMAAKSSKKKNIGHILCGFAILMFSMEMMKDAVAPLADSPEFASLLTAFSVPIISVIIGAVFTGAIQSSAATLGILQTLALTGSITYNMAIPIVMGLNIGTCVTAVLSSIGVNKAAKRVAVVHISFNILGTVICMAAFYGLDAIFHFSFTDMPITPLGVAFVHTVFNVVTTVILLPFTKQLEKIACFIVKDKKDKNDVSTLLDDRLLRTPSVAVNESRSVTKQMAALAQESVALACALVNKYDKKTRYRL